MTDKTCWTGTACSARCFWAASPQRGSWRQPAQGKYSFPCDDWNRLKICGNHLLPARGFRQDATHRLDRCIVAPLLRKRFPSYPLFHTFCNSFFHACLGKCLFQNVHHIIVRQHFRPYQETFQHSPSGTEPMRPFLPGKLLHLVFQYLFFVLCPPQSGFAFGKLLVELFQLFIHHSSPPSWGAACKCGSVLPRPGAPAGLVQRPPILSRNA